ncbi:MAG: hypothetical protein ACE366_12990 [Bradymonadia bacterium]
MSTARWARALIVGGALWGGIAEAQKSTEPSPADLYGRMTLRGYYSTDNASLDYPEPAYVFLDADVRADKLTEGGLKLVLDSTFIFDINESNERRFGETEEVVRARSFYVLQPLSGGDVELAMGRRLIFEAGNAWVDGVDVNFAVADNRKAVVGVYGGLSPDPYDTAFNTEYQAAGLYGSLHREGFDLSLAANTMMRDGEQIRQFGFNRIHMKLTEDLFVSSYLVMDFIDGPNVATYLGTLDYTPTQPLNLMLTYSHFSLADYSDPTVFRNVLEPNQRDALGLLPLDLAYDRVRFQASLNFGTSYYHYQSVEYRTRDQGQNRGDDSAWQYIAGLRDDDLFGVGARADLQGVVLNNFVSDSYTLLLDLEYDAGQWLTLNALLSYFTGRTIGRASGQSRTFDEEQTLYTVQGGVLIRPNRHHQIDLNYEALVEAEVQDLRNDDPLLIHTINAAYNYFF